MSHKTCRSCGESKSLSMFHFRKDSGRHREDCAVCRNTAEAARRYGLTVGDIESLKATQGNRCAICKTHADDIPHATFKHNPLVIDHDHLTGRVRGLLCPTCNLVLGHAKDNVTLLADAISYLTKAP